jgi:hypothetical protein
LPWQNFAEFYPYPSLFAFAFDFTAFFVAVCPFFFAFFLAEFGEA